MTAGDWDAVTVSFATADLRVCGLIRHGLAAAADGGGALASALAVLFVERSPRVLLAAGGVPVESPSWEELAVDGLRTAVASDGWTISGAGLELRITPASAAASVPGSVGGLAGDERLVRVDGVVSHDGARLPIDALGQRGHAWGSPDWDRLEAVRTASVWLSADRGSTVTAARFAGAGGHERDEIWGAVWEDAEADTADEPRLSTTYDGDGHQRRVGMELWFGDAYDEDAHAYRAAGYAVCGSTVELGRLRLDCAFMTWTAAGATGVGRYDLLSRQRAT